MKVSVIVPTYQRPELLAEALASIMAQRYPPDQFEAVVVHDGPNCMQPAWYHPAHFRFIRQEHKGLSAAVNYGVRLARGEYISILSDDDFIYPNKFVVLAGYLDVHPEADAVYSLPMYVDQDGNNLGTPERNRGWLTAHSVVTWETVRAGHGILIHGTSILYRRTMCIEAGPWDETLKGGEEWEYHLRLLSMGYVFHGVDAVTTAYRVHPGQKSGRRFRRTTARFELRRRINERYADRLTRPAPDRRIDVAAHA
jgi:alpha-1,6-rhamnosyltransferase